MYGVVLAGQALLVLLMVVVSYWGSKKIDPETRIRARSISLDSTMRGRTTALVWAPAVGLLVLLGTLAINDSPSRDTAALLGLGVIAMFLLAHWSSVKRAAR